MKKGANAQEVGEKIAEIEDEMKRIGLWRDEPLREEQYEFRQAFAMDTMTLSQWLQFIFVPKVKAIIAAGGEFPGKSQVGAHALREFDAWNDAERLLGLLSEFDALFGAE